MNFKILISFILAAFIFVYTIIAKGGDNPYALIDVHAAIIVIGGTAACGAISFNIDRIFVLLKIFIQRVIWGKRSEYRDTIRELMLIADEYRSGSSKLDTRVNELQDPFLKEAVSILKEGYLSEDDMRDILKMRVKTISERYASEAQMFSALGKYPPAMGLMGAVVGMVALLGALGRPGAENMIGPAMSVALLATFYGIAVANLVIIPIGEHLLGAAKELELKNNMIVEGVILISQKTNPILLAEKLNSFLLPQERLDMKEVTGRA